MMIRLKYKDFEFPQNPAEISVEKSKEISERSLLSAGSAVEEIAQTAAKITASGRFFGSAARSAAARLSALYDDSGAGELYLPDGEYYRAYFTDLQLKQNAAEGAVEYSVSFVQDKGGGCYRAGRSFVFAKDGENCFDIAYANQVPVEDIIELNGFKTPFEPQEGQPVRIR